MNISEVMELVSLARYEEALDAVESLSKEERECWETENVLGIICAQYGQYEEAISFYRRALRYKADVAEIYYNLADAYCRTEQYEQAEVLLKSCAHLVEDKEFLEEIEKMLREIKGKTEEKKERNALMIAYYFPPLSGSGVFRSLKYAKYLPEMGWKPTVISTDMPPLGWNFRDDSMVEEIPDEVEVIRIPDNILSGRETSMKTSEVRELVLFLSGILKDDKEAMSLLGTLLSDKQNISLLIQFPCACLKWAYDVIQHIEQKMDLRKYQILYTTSGPASSHLVGYYLKKKYGITWIADYRDPWTDNPYDSYDMSNPLHKLFYLLEKLLLKAADCNIVVDSSRVGDYQRKFGLSEEQITEITNGYDEWDFAKIAIPREKTGKFTITYSGLLYSQQRSIRPVLNAVKNLIDKGKLSLDNFMFWVVGEGNEAENIQQVTNYGLENCFVQTGYISHEEAIKINLMSDFLLLFVGDEEKFKPVFTGKIFDYLRSGKPILALAPKGGAVDSLLEETGHGKCLYSTQTEEIEEMILYEYQKWQKRTENEISISPFIKKHERRYLTMKLADLFYTKGKELPEVKEIESNVYNAGYLSGGADRSYHKHYKESFYYPSWKYAMKHLLLLDRNIKILEIACGVGQFANMLFDTGFTNYRGFDFAEEGVKIAKERMPLQQEKFFVADAFETPEVAEQNDLVICFEMLEHINKDLELLQRIPSGVKVLLSVPNFDDPNHVRFFASEQEVYNRYKDVINIFDIGRSMINSVNCLYYIVGEKK